MSKDIKEFIDLSWRSMHEKSLGGCFGCPELVDIHPMLEGKSTKETVLILDGFFCAYKALLKTIAKELEMELKEYK